MKKIALFIILITTFGHAQSNVTNKIVPITTENYIKSVDNLTLEAALEIAKRVNKAAATLDKKVTLAVLDASGTTILIMRGEGIGPHNTEAARRKAYTALSTKTATLLLLRNAESNIDSKNLNSLPELLLLSGGTPIYYKGNVVGSVGVAGGGSAENDDLIAKAGTITEFGITTTK